MRGNEQPVDELLGASYWAKVTKALSHARDVQRTLGKVKLLTS
jgi:hypothetical protein